MGVFVNSSAGQINLGQNGGDDNIGGVGITNNNVLNNSDGTIRIAKTNGNAIKNNSGGTFENSNNSVIYIGQIGGFYNIGKNGIANNAIFNNNGSTIHIDNVFQDGISNLSGGNFTNSNAGQILIGPNSIIWGAWDAIENHATFTNDGGTIDIDTPENYGIKCQNGDFNNINNGQINIISSWNIGVSVLGSSNFTNSGTLSISYCSENALSMVSTSQPPSSNFDNTSGILKVYGDMSSVLHMAGTLAPGNSPGQFSVYSELHLPATTLEIEVDGTTPVTQHDLVTVGTDAHLGGALSVSINYTPVSNDRIVFLTANDINGTFSSVSPPLPANWALDYSISGEVALQFSGILPVELVDFSAAKNEDDVLLKWQTASETNNEGFEIEHGTDGRNWDYIGFIDGHGNATETHDYTFLHKGPSHGMNYYRLRQIDSDGQSDYSEIRSVAFENLNGPIKVFPQPCDLPFQHSTSGKFRAGLCQGERYGRVGSL